MTSREATKILKGKTIKSIDLNISTSEGKRVADPIIYFTDGTHMWITTEETDSGGDYGHTLSLSTNGTITPIGAED